MFQAAGPEKDKTTVKESSELFNIDTIVQKLGAIFTSNLPDAMINKIGELDVGTMTIAKNFGLSREQADMMKSSIIGSRDEVFKLGGDFNTIFKTQTDVGVALGRNVTLGVEGQRELLAAYKVSGVEIGKIVNGFKDVGISAYDAGNQMAKVVNAARETGANAKATSTMVMENISAMNKFNFKDGVDGLARMAAQSVALRINMNDVLQVSEKAFNPEGAIKMAAELQRLGVQQSALLDPLSLMNLAENDPEELQKQLASMSKQFVQLNEQGQFEILPGAKRQMRAIEESLGMTRGSLYKMAIASAEVDEKLKKIQLPDFATDEQKRLLANVAEMKDGKMMIEVDGKSMQLDEALKSVSNKEDLEKLIGATEDKTIEELAVDQLDMLESINIGIGMLNGILPAAVAGTSFGKAVPTAVGTTFREGGISAVEAMGGTQKITETMDTMLEDIKKKYGGKVGMEGVKDMYGTITNSESFKNFQTQLDKAGTAMKGIANAIKPEGAASANLSFTTLATAAENFKNGVSEFIKSFKPSKDLIISPKAGNFQTLEEDEIVAGTGISDMLSKLGEIKKTVGVESLDLISKMSIPKVNKETVKGETKGTEKITFDLNINITAPSQVDTEEVKKLFKDPLVLQPLMMKMEEVASNYSLGKKA